MENKEYYKNILLELKEEADNIEAQWSGDENGKQEENAYISHDIKIKVDEILDLMDTLN